MSWWVQFPLDFLSDPRVQVLPLSAQGLLTRLILHGLKRGGNVIPYVNHHDALGTVAVIGLREGAPADAEASVGDDFRKMADAGLLSWDDDARELRTHLSSASPPRARGADPMPVRTKPSDEAARVTSRADQHYFEKRQRFWKHVPAGVTWEAWLASAEGQSWLTRPRGRGVATAQRPATAPATPLATPPCNTAGNAPATPLPSHTLPSEKDREKETSHTELQRLATPPATATQQGVATEVATEGEAGGRATPRAGTFDLLGLAAGEVMAVLRARCRRRLTLSGEGALLGPLQRLVSELSAHDGWGLGDYEVLGDWIAAGGLGWWTQGRPSLSYLLRPGMLAKHLEDARDWHEGGRPAIVHRGGAGPGARRAAPVSPAADFNDDGDDPLLALARGP